MDKNCKQCGKTNVRPRSDFCSQKCSRAYRSLTVSKNCEYCGVKHHNRGRTCSPEHANSLKKLTNRKKFGADWAIQTSEAKEKRVDSNLKKYGVEHHLQSSDSLRKLRETNLEKYGVEWVGASREVQDRIKDTNLKNHGVENVFASEEVQERVKETNLERYGVEYSVQSEEVQDKIKDTNLRKYGVDNVFASQEIQEQIKETNLEKYGVEYASQADSVKDKIRRTNLKKYGVSSPLKLEEIKEKIKKTNLERHGVEYPSQSSVTMSKIRKSYEETINAPDYLGGGRVSNLNRSFAKVISEEYDVEVALEVAYDEYSFDLGVKGANIVIELNPTITHNVDKAYACVINKCSNNCLKHKAIPNNYHQKKAKYAKSRGLRLIQLYEWDFPRALLLLDGRLRKGFVKHSARKLVLVELSRVEANCFLSDNHFQGGVRGQKYVYGLKDGEELLAVASFGDSRFGAKASHEWLRYAVKRGHIIHGGSNKLFSHFLEEVVPDSVISYVDFDHTTGETFLSSCGFTELKETSPALIWSNRGEKISNSSLVSQGADRLLGTSYGSREESGLSNVEIMSREGWSRVYTSGNRVFLWSKER